ncbi:MAG: hypothetical protein QOE93_134, partial [Actinomycetota bacterium]|nr:hypothetical protein [Actinomycetota bacterium]
AGEHWDVPFLSIPDMARTHGVANAVGFVVAGLVGGRLASPAGLFPGRMSDPALAARHRAAVAGEVTYPDPGRTLAEGGPMVVSRPIGHGPDAFAAAVQALRDWAPQHSIGARVYPADAPLEVGTTVLVVLRAGPLEVVAPDRIVAFVDEPGRFGYAYGTLPGHPERGEESFVVRLEPSGTVTATVTVDARPGLWPMAAVGPAVRVLQRAAARRYVATLHRAVTTAGTAGTAARSSR